MLGGRATGTLKPFLSAAHAHTAYMGVRPPGFEVFAFVSLDQQELLKVTSNALFVYFRSCRILFVLQSSVYLAVAQIKHTRNNTQDGLANLRFGMNRTSRLQRTNLIDLLYFVSFCVLLRSRNRKGMNYEGVNCFECAVLGLEVSFEFICVSLAAIQNS